MSDVKIRKEGKVVLQFDVIDNRMSDLRHRTMSQPTELSLRGDGIQARDKLNRVKRDVISFETEAVA